MVAAFMIVMIVASLSHPSLQQDNDIEDQWAEVTWDDQLSKVEDREWGWGGGSCCRRLGRKLHNAKKDICENTKKINETCNALTELLSVMQPEYDPNAAGCPPAPMPNPVSAAIGSDTGSEYPIIFPITLNGAALQDGIAPEGLNTADSQPQTLGTSMDQAALSITDFNVFRIQMVKALRILDKSVRGILNTQAPTCP